MKKLLLVLFSLTIALGAVAQEKVRFGIKGGITLSSVEGKGTDGANMKAGGNVSAFIEYRFHEKWAFSPELKFTMDGFALTFKENVSDYTYSYDTNINYVAIPLMFKLFPIDNFNVHFGPEIGYAVYTKMEGVSIGPAINRFNFGLGCGVTYYFIDNVFGELRLTSGLTNVVKTQGIKDATNKGLRGTICFGYRF